jgi:predicted nucleotidyltransferase
MSSSNEPDLRETIRSVFRGKPVERVELFGSAARGRMTPQSDVDILATPSPAATRRDLFVMAAEVEDAVGRQVDFLIRADVEAMTNFEARDLILDKAVTLYVSGRKTSLNAYRNPLLV